MIAGAAVAVAAVSNHVDDSAVGKLVENEWKVQEMLGGLFDEEVPAVKILHPVDLLFEEIDHVG